MNYVYLVEGCGWSVFRRRSPCKLFNPANSNDSVVIRNVFQYNFLYSNGDPDPSPSGFTLVISVSIWLYMIVKKKML